MSKAQAQGRERVYVKCYNRAFAILTNRPRSYHHIEAMPAPNNACTRPPSAQVGTPIANQLSLFVDECLDENGGG